MPSVKKTFKHAAILATACAVTITILQTPLVAQETAPIYSPLTNRCLQPANGSSVAGAAIVQGVCSGNDNSQQWSVAAQKFPYIHFVNRRSGMCLDARGGARNGTPLQQWPCNKISNELWVYQPKNSGPVPPPNLPWIFSGVAHSYPNFCIDIPAGQNRPGLGLQIYKCNGTRWQQLSYALLETPQRKGTDREALPKQ